VAAVVVMLVPIRPKGAEPIQHLIGGRRGIPPKKGEVAFPAGYINRGETWRDAASRELKEETGIDIEPWKWGLVTVHSSEKHLLTVVQVEPIECPDFGTLEYDHNETQELVLIDRSTQLCFSSHQTQKMMFFGL